MTDHEMAEIHEKNRSLLITNVIADDRAVEIGDYRFLHIR